MYHRRCAIWKRSRRHGHAPVELIMASPLILTMLVVLFVLGDGMIKLSQATIESRTDAWSRREQSQSTQGVLFFFPSSTTGTIVAGHSSKSVRVPRVLGDFPPITAEHSVMTGSWDYRQIQLDAPPSFDIYARVGGSGLLGGGQGLANMLSGGLSSLLGGMSNSFAGDLAAFQGAKDSFRNTASQAVNENEGKRREDRENEQNAINTLRNSTIPGLENRVAALDDQIKSVVEPKANEKTKAGQTVRGSAERLGEIEAQLLRTKNPLNIQALRQEQEELAAALSEVDQQLPQLIRQRAEARHDLLGAQEDLQRREEAFRRGKQAVGSGALDTGM